MLRALYYRPIELIAFLLHNRSASLKQLLSQHRMWHKYVARTISLLFLFAGTCCTIMTQRSSRRMLIGFIG